MSALEAEVLSPAALKTSLRSSRVHGIGARETASEEERAAHVAGLKELRLKVEARTKQPRQLCCLAREFLAVIGSLEYVAKETGQC